MPGSAALQVGRVDAKPFCDSFFILGGMLAAVAGTTISQLRMAARAIWFVVTAYSNCAALILLVEIRTVERHVPAFQPDPASEQLDTV
jgi:hypothetical protein